MIRRPLACGQCALVISSASNEYLALYRCDAVADLAYMLAIRSQRECATGNNFFFLEVKNPERRSHQRSSIDHSFVTLGSAALPDAHLAL